MCPPAAPVRIRRAIAGCDTPVQVLDKPTAADHDRRAGS